MIKSEHVKKHYYQKKPDDDTIMHHAQHVIWVRSLAGISA